MGKIFSAPSSIEVPRFKYGGDGKTVAELRAAYHAAEAKYFEDLKAVLVKRKNQKHVGEVIRFPVADGYAMYMVASLSPVELVELALGDAWQYQYAHRLTKADIIQKIESQQAMAKLFSKKS